MSAASDPEAWVFAYGSLLWRPDFEFSHRVRGFVRGWTRRFWQGSPDHRGVPEAPGRVVTLVPDAAELCWGVAYRLSEPTASATLAALDFRERGGYERHVVEFHGDDASSHSSRVGAPASQRNSWPVLVYLASDQNQHYLGQAPLPGIAEQVRRAVGPSGSNIDYVFRLEAALGALAIEDAHVSEVARLLRGAAPAAAPEGDDGTEQVHHPALRPTPLPRV